MFNIGFAELLAIILVCLVVFGPERLPEVARQLGRFIGQARLTTQRMLDELRSESELKELNLPDLKVGNLRNQARSYVTGLLDVEGQMAELEREAKDEKKPTRKPATSKRPQLQASADGPADAADPASPAGDTSSASSAGATSAAGAASSASSAGSASTISSASTSTASGDGLPPVDPDAT